MIQGYNYTDLMAVVNIDAAFCSGTIYAVFEPSTGTTVEVTTTNYDLNTGDVLITVPQTQSANMYGVTSLQLNGILNGARWASEKVYFLCGNNSIRRTLS